MEDTTTTTLAPVPVTEPVTVPVAPPDTTPTAPPEPPAQAPPPPVPLPVGDGGDDLTVDPASFNLVLDNRPRTADSSTAELLDALRPLTALGFSEQEAFVLGMGQFPVAGLATWSDDFRDPRYNPTPHYHQGNDIWADHGTPVRSPTRGEAELTGEAVGGISVYVTADDGTYYYMTHLAGTADGLQTGDIVEQGQVVGYTGATGNAAGGPPHVHFEIHPGGGAAVNPKPILDQWVAEALAAAPASRRHRPWAPTPGCSWPRASCGASTCRPWPPRSGRPRARCCGRRRWLRAAPPSAWPRWRRPAWPSRSTGAGGPPWPRPPPPTATGPRPGRCSWLSRLTPPGLRSVLDGSTS